MKVRTIVIEHYRSIEKIVLNLPEGKPLVLFGPNNAGKSNILSAIHRLLGDRHPTYIEMLESDYFLRNREKYPTAMIGARFSHPLYYDNRRNGQMCLTVSYGYGGDATNNLLHDGTGMKLFPTNEQRAACQSYMIEAERNIQFAFNYSSRYSLLSKFSHKIHEALTNDHKLALNTAFAQIKGAFEETKEFSDFFEQFTAALQGSVRGFVHSLSVDFSAYDPNNYAKSLRIYAREGDHVRGFEEFGTGEQQVLLMAFAKAYMQVFTGENFILIIEEPEAHLHPLAQRWLKEYMVEMCTAGIQVVISTHSTEFFDPEYLDGLVRVYKVAGVTKIKQLTAKDLFDYCVSVGVPKEKVTPDNIIDFYNTRLFQDQLKGLYAETIILVEGETEANALPAYFKKSGFSLAEHGIEIVNCRGKTAIPLYWRLYKAFGYNCYCIFDCDSDANITTGVFENIFSDNWKTDKDFFHANVSYAYFGKDFESYLRSTIPEYEAIEIEIAEKYHISSKPGIAKAVAMYLECIPSFVGQIINMLKYINMFGQVSKLDQPLVDENEAADVFPF